MYRKTLFSLFLSGFITKSIDLLMMVVKNERRKGRSKFNVMHFCYEKGYNSFEKVWRKAGKNKSCNMPMSDLTLYLKLQSNVVQVHQVKLCTLGQN